VSATQKNIVPRLPRKRGGAQGTPGRTSDPVHPTPWQCTLSHACQAKEAETQGTPGHTSDPLAMHIVPRLPRKRGGDPMKEDLFQACTVFCIVAVTLP